ncbi:endoribonuclease ZC3H12A [Gouania willdenowi]|uniref:Endoribonuclease ZC3H12A-like n=1 Tax=Gouania willdenowi TaxID=441366 RepID=A0A8C5DMD6_GOUWI|nr:endoribonuclease ZC3H12A-like [Gouania willdenowi]XP_028316971.1 endoribonuclease ZC3H12A-like [Gouania willdenowi]XP_028316972.1 endoribonuclease ZC3H12A-like [Gouania willdenowi]
MHPGDPESTPESQLPEAQLDFFHKLGYSTAQVQAVQHTFGTDTDKMLGQLVLIGASPEFQQGPVTTLSVLRPPGEERTGGSAVVFPVSGQSREEDEDILRPIVIDGSNVAMSHGNKEVFSCLGIQLAVNFFLDRGHSDITVFVPSWRKEQPRPDVPITDQHILRDLERRKLLVFTPSRRVAGKRVVCNDDCFIVKHAFQSDGIMVSNDMYRDLQGEKPEWKRFIEERLLMYSFVNNKFMPPDDPLGRHGPTLDNFLRRFAKIQKKQLCPYGKKCTYGVKCKFLHPERPKHSNRLLADELRENTKQTPTPPSFPSALCGQSLLLVEDMARKLTLGPESGSLKKDNRKTESTKMSHRSSRKTSSRKDRPPPQPTSEHEELLDSGLGSIDSLPMDAQRSLFDHQFGPPPSLSHHHSVRQPFCLPPMGPCCAHSAPPALGPTPPFQPTCVRHYGPAQYPGFCSFQLGIPGYTQPSNFQPGHVHPQHRPQFWSDPFGAQPPPMPHRPREHSHSHPHRDRVDQHPTNRAEREATRKKLLAIFSAPLVDKAMEMFPQVLDPQVLVAEILQLQSQGRAPR